MSAVLGLAAAALLVLALVLFGGGSGGGGLRGGGGPTTGPTTGSAAAAEPFNAGAAAAAARNLVVVAGHSVSVAGSDLRGGATDEAAWHLLPYQRGRGLPQAIAAHLREGLRLAAADPGALLVLSGGETRGGTGPLSEAASYFQLADALGMWGEQGKGNWEEAASSSTGKGQGGGQGGGQGEGEGGGDDGGEAMMGTATAAGAKNSHAGVRARTVTEEYATDSFQNLLFSICRFREVTGRYPEHVTVVSFTFKRARFEAMHAAALRWPGDRFRYAGVDPPPGTGFDLPEAAEGERLNAARPFEGDPYGCHTPVLRRKRAERNPFFRTPPYSLTCPDMTALLDWCGPGLIPGDQVPWPHA